VSEAARDDLFCGADDEARTRDPLRGLDDVARQNIPAVRDERPSEVASAGVKLQEPRATSERRPSGWRVSGLRLSGLRLSGLRPAGWRVSGLRLSGLRVSGWRASGLRLSGLRVSGLRVSGCRVSGCRVSGCRVSGCRVSNGVPDDADERGIAGGAGLREVPRAADEAGLDLDDRPAERHLGGSRPGVVVAV
jgi:hypothetical protein